MNEQSSKQIEIRNIPKFTVAFDTENSLFGEAAKPPPEFKNDVEKIIYILEHENDPLTADQLRDQLRNELTQTAAEAIRDSVDEQIIKTLGSITNET